MAVTVSRNQQIVTMTANTDTYGVNATQPHSWVPVGSVIFYNGGTAGSFTIQDGYGVQIGLPVYVGANLQVQLYFDRSFYGFKLTALPANAVGIAVLLRKIQGGART